MLTLLIWSSSLQQAYVCPQQLCAQFGADLQSLQGLVELNTMAWQEPAIHQMPKDPSMDPK